MDMYPCFRSLFEIYMFFYILTAKIYFLLESVFSFESLLLLDSVDLEAGAGVGARICFSTFTGCPIVRP